MRPVAEGKELAFVLDLPEAPVEIQTDAGKGRQILINLCGNAIKYTRAGEVRLGVRREGQRVVFRVEDTGIGIAAEDQTHVFERFWQVDGGPTRVVGGMGIGLAAAQEYAKLLGGEVDLESRLGGGSTFRLWLPLRPGPG